MATMGAWVMVEATGNDDVPLPYLSTSPFPFPSPFPPPLPPPPLPSPPSPSFISDTSPEERTALFIRKLEQCCYIFDFADPMSDVKAKEIKRAALNEILDYISNARSVLSEPVYPEIVRMVSGLMSVKVSKKN